MASCGDEAVPVRGLPAASSSPCPLLLYLHCTACFCAYRSKSLHSQGRTFSKNVVVLAAQKPLRDLQLGKICSCDDAAGLQATIGAHGPGLVGEIFWEMVP